MSLSVLRAPRTIPDPEELGGAPAPGGTARLTAIVQLHSRAIWRTLLRLGVASEALDDATQEVFIVMARRLEQIEPGRAKSFLYATAVRVASNHRRSRCRRREEPLDETQSELPVLGLSPDELLDQKRVRVHLERVLSTMPEELREVFVLFEFEQLSRSEIAPILGLPVGTVGSRLRRARELFEQQSVAQGLGGAK